MMFKFLQIYIMSILQSYKHDNYYISNYSKNFYLREPRRLQIKMGSCYLLIIFQN